jgi:hypothetical protein
MAIVKTNRAQYGTNNPETTERLFVGRVVRIETTVETRNWSDTLDYTDMRSTSCTWALVYLGTHGVPPRDHFGRPIAQCSPSSWDEPRDLEVGEQFGWVDCTNLFADRNGFRLEATVDTLGDQLLWGGPEMLDALTLWDAHAAQLAVEAEEKRVAAEAARKAALVLEAEKAAKKAAKDDAARIEAEKLIARIPPKGTTVTVDGFTGKVFWTGASKYYGKWTARAGVKNAKGTVQWVSADRF